MFLKVFSAHSKVPVRIFFLMIDIRTPTPPIFPISAIFLSFLCFLPIVSYVLPLSLHKFLGFFCYSCLTGFIQSGKSWKKVPKIIFLAYSIPCFLSFTSSSVYECCNLQCKWVLFLT